MAVTHIRIATRKSALALWQAKFVQQTLVRIMPDLTTELIEITTKADRFLKSNLRDLGGKNLFVKELEEKLLENQADIAVHSMKDVPAVLPSDLHIPAIMRREDPRDVLISRDGMLLHDLPKDAVIGTSSLRRRCQLCAERPDLVVQDLRGNINTRLAKLEQGLFDGIVIAYAGIKRLGLPFRGTILELETMLPAPGQGAIGIECRAKDEHTTILLQQCHDLITGQVVAAERAVGANLYGGCQMPVAAHATIDAQHRLSVHALVGMADGSEIIHRNITGDTHDTEACGALLAKQILDAGGDRILSHYVAS